MDIEIGTTVRVTQMFNKRLKNNDWSQSVETRIGVIVGKKCTSLLGDYYDVEYPNGRTHGAYVDQIEPMELMLPVRDTKEVNSA